LSPLFFAHSSLAHLDLAVALFTTLALVALLHRRALPFAVVASLAVMSKETAVVLLPVACLFAFKRWCESSGSTVAHNRLRVWTALLFPVLPLLAWSIYYHRVTGFWTGNREYLEYNLYSTLNPVRILVSFLRRLYEVFVSGFNWVLVMGGILGAVRRRRREVRDSGCGTRDSKLGDRISASDFESPVPSLPSRTADFLFLAAALCLAYILMLSVVGGAILPRYLLPIYPAFFLAGVRLIWELPRPLARGLCVGLAACLVGSWFINPPYPFPFEDNLAYTDFVRLHQGAARFVEGDCPGARILTAWPASGELAQPFLGYVSRPARVVPVEGFAVEDFGNTSPQAFDLVYLYSRRWEPVNNWLLRLGLSPPFLKRYFGYAPQIQDEVLVRLYHLDLLKEFTHRGQWARIYGREPAFCRP